MGRTRECIHYNPLAIFVDYDILENKIYLISGTLLTPYITLNPKSHIMWGLFYFEITSIFLIPSLKKILTLVARRFLNSEECWHCEVNDVTSSARCSRSLSIGVYQSPNILRIWIESPTLKVQMGFQMPHSQTQSCPPCKAEVQKVHLYSSFRKCV